MSAHANGFADGFDWAHEVDKDEVKQFVNTLGIELPAVITAELMNLTWQELATLLGITRIAASKDCKSRRTARGVYAYGFKEGAALGWRKT